MRCLFQVLRERCFEVRSWPTASLEVRPQAATALRLGCSSSAGKTAATAGRSRVGFSSEGVRDDCILRTASWRQGQLCRTQKVQQESVKRGGRGRVSVPHPTPSRRTKKRGRLTVKEEEL